MLENVGESKFAFELVLGTMKMRFQGSFKNLLWIFTAKIIND